jgi:DNA-directed RNA polymerase, mitochondrial
MTFAYSVTPAGATLQIARVYKSFPQNAKPANGAFGYLAKKVLQACALELSGPKRVMDYICAVADHCAKEGRFLGWTSPSGFPVSNRYQKPNVVNVTCLRGCVRVAQHRVADGVTDEIDHAKAVAAAAPNFIHSLDAAHLIKVVNAAVSEGITDLLTVHDCFYCLAPHATRLHNIILGELANLYDNNDPLTELRSRNVSVPDILPVPPKGTPFTWADGKDRGWRTSFSLERVKKAKNAFG